MHFPVPVGNNAVGVSYKEALFNSGQAGGTVLPVGEGAGQITQAELTEIEAGDVLEHVVDYPTESGGSSSAEREATLRAFYLQEQARVCEEQQEVLKFFGYTQEVTT